MTVPQKSSEEQRADTRISELSPPSVTKLLERHFPEINDDIGSIDILACGVGPTLVKLRYEKRFARPGGTISGPTMFKLADLACYVAILSRLGEAAVDSVTTTLTINFLARPVPSDLICTVDILRQGRRQVVCEARIHSCDTAQAEDGTGTDRMLGRMVAQASCIYALPMV